MEEGGAKSVKVGETEEEGDESGYEQLHSTHALTVWQFTSAVQGNVSAWEYVWTIAGGLASGVLVVARVELRAGNVESLKLSWYYGAFLALSLVQTPVRAQVCGEIMQVSGLGRR